MEEIAKEVAASILDTAFMARQMREIVEEKNTLLNAQADEINSLENQLTEARDNLSISTSHLRDRGDYISDLENQLREARIDNREHNPIVPTYLQGVLKFDSDEPFMGLKPFYVPTPGETYRMYIPTIKAVRELTGCNLKEAKDAVDVWRKQGWI